MLNKRRALLVNLVIMLLISGCTVLPGEERSFAVVLCIDYADDNWQVYARVPAYQKDGGYATVAAQHAALDSALVTLENASPLRMHLGQLRMVVVGPNVMETDKMSEALTTLAQRGDFRYDALLTCTFDDVYEVCSCFEPLTGTRLSKSIDKQIETKANQGIMVHTTINDALRYGSRQSLCLPLLQIIYQEEHPFIELTDTVMFDRSLSVKERLSPRETQLISLLNGRFKQGVLQIGNQSIRVQSNHSKIKLKNNHEVDVNLELECNMRIDAREAEQMINDALHNLLEKLQMSSCDALGIARQAIRRYNNWQEWLIADWQSEYQQLTWNLHVCVR